ncbi:hypothetical protein MELB17_08341 [Marinobacter sp. ELB17]|nr:hypothetical protein MELB17_08341 [Marinobacter sp. ELB17]
MLIPLQILTIFLLFYLLIKKRRFDLFTFSGFFYFIYFSPIILDLLYDPFSLRKLQPSEEVYIILSMVGLGTFLFAILNDYLFYSANRTRNPFVLSNNLYALKYLSLVLLLFLGFIFYIYGFESMVRIKIDEFNIPYFSIIVWFALVILSLSLRNNNWLAFLISAGFIIFLLLAGVRSYFVVGVFIVIFMTFGKSNVRLISQFKLFIFGVLLVSVIFGYKPVYKSVINGDFSNALRFYSSVSVNDLAYVIVEPMYVSSHLVYVVSDGLDMSFRYFSEQLSGAIPFLKGLITRLGWDFLPSFQTTIQEKYYAGVEYGVASNFWAEIYSIGDFPLVFLFVLALNVFVLYVNRIFQSGGFYKSIWVPAGVYFSFYVHRIDLSIFFSVIKYSVIFLMFIFLVSQLFKYAQSCWPKKISGLE